MLALGLAAPQPVHAQLDIRGGAGDRFVMIQPKIDVPLQEFLAEGATIQAQTRRSVDVVVFVARASEGRIVAQGQTRPFRLDAKAASSSTGMTLVPALSERELLALAPLTPLREVPLAAFTTTRESVSASELLRRPQAAFNAENVRHPTVIRDHADVLLVAVVPADEGMRSRSRAGLLFLACATGEH